VPEEDMLQGRGDQPNAGDRIGHDHVPGMN
jgi:hypothetical protein